MHTRENDFNRLGWEDLNYNDVGEADKIFTWTV